MSTINFPAGRYGHRREPRGPRRLVLPVLVVLGVVAGGAVGAAMYLQHGAGRIHSQVLTIDYNQRDHVTVTFEVAKPGGAPATCFVRARDRAGSEVGHAEVAVPAGRTDQNSVTMTYTLATSGKPNTGEVYGCTLDEPR